jgi:hypothetical protein
MNKPTFFEVQASSRKKFGLTEIDSNEFETAKAIYFDYWPPMQSRLSALKIDKKPIKFKS